VDIEGTFRSGNTCMSNRILIVDDDDLLRRSLAFSLEQAGFQTNTSDSAENAIAMVTHNRPDLVLLDIMLPGMDGIAALRQFREEMGIPVIFLTARRRELDQILGLELGADDYIAKPFNPDLLIAHIHAVLRRTAAPKPSVSAQSPALVVGDLRIDPASRTVTRGGREINLTVKEFDLLYALASEPYHVLSIDELLGRVWGAEYTGEPQIVYVHIRWLRQKIENDPEQPNLIVTVRGKGYKLVPGK
jgi:DNA-binding response OmpR family regulator